MISVAVCDDEKNFLSVFSHSMKKLLGNNDDNISVSAYLNVSQFLNDHEQSPFDIVFLDIEMPEIGGFQCTERLRKVNEDTIIVFVTNHENYVFHSFVFRPFRFIRKSHFEDELEEALSSAVKLYYEKTKLYNISSEKGLISVRLSDIMYFDVYSHSVFMHMKNEKIIVKKSLQEVENELGDFGFIRVHKSYLVSFRYIYSVRTGSVTLVNMESVPLSKHRIKEVKEKMIYYTKRFES